MNELMVSGKISRKESLEGQLCESEGLVYSGRSGIYLFRGNEKSPAESDIFIAPVSADCLCYHKGRDFPNGTLLDQGGTDLSRIRDNRNPTHETYGAIFETLTNRFVSNPEYGVQLLCSSGGELFGAGLRMFGDEYVYYLSNILTGENLAEKFSLREQVSAMCDHNGELVLGLFNGTIQKGKEIIRRRGNIITGLASVNGTLYDASEGFTPGFYNEIESKIETYPAKVEKSVVKKEGEHKKGVLVRIGEFLIKTAKEDEPRPVSGYGRSISEIRNTLTGELIGRRRTTHGCSPKLLSLNGILYDLNYTGSAWELRETASGREIPIGKTETGYFDYDEGNRTRVGDVCSVSSDIVDKVLRRGKPGSVFAERRDN
jgi:hypothetical protein